MELVINRIADCRFKISDLKAKFAICNLFYEIELQIAEKKVKSAICNLKSKIALPVGQQNAKLVQQELSLNLLARFVVLPRKLGTNKRLNLTKLTI